MFAAVADMTRYIEKTIGLFKPLIRQNIDNIDIGDISRYFRLVNPSLPATASTLTNISRRISSSVQ